MVGMDEGIDNTRRVIVPKATATTRSEIGNRRALRDIRNLVGSQRYPCTAIAKRGPERKNVENDNPCPASRRPMTRQFVASLSRSQSHEQKIEKERQSKKPPKNLMNLDHFHASVATEVEDRKPVTELAMPMAEDMEGILEEVEMEEDTAVEQLPDIDGLDSKNPLNVVEYIQDIYNFYRKTEIASCVSPDYMSNQADINEKMRAILIDWLIEVHYKFELMDETLYLTVNIIDRFLSRQPVARKKLQLVGVTAMLLACKYEEVSVPLVEDLILISDRAYSRAEVLEMERLIVGVLQFDMSVSTPYVFVRRFLKAAQSNTEMDLLAFFIVELCLVEYRMLAFHPSLLAAAAVYTAQCTITRCKQWSKASELHSLYSEDQLLDCARLMVDFHQKAGEGRLTGVHRKYSTFKFGCAAKAEPALFLLDKM